MRHLLIAFLLTNNVLAQVDEKKPANFIDNGDGTVTDTTTGLMWSAWDNGKDILWEEAKRYCENYSGGGYSDWRMPTIEELQQLYNAHARISTPCDLQSIHLIYFSSSLTNLNCFLVWSTNKYRFARSWTTTPIDHEKYYDITTRRAYAATRTTYARALPVRAAPSEQKSTH